MILIFFYIAVETQVDLIDISCAFRGDERMNKMGLLSDILCIAFPTFFCSWETFSVKTLDDYYLKKKVSSLQKKYNIKLKPILPKWSVIFHQSWLFLRIKIPFHRIEIFHIFITKYLTIVIDVNSRKSWRIFQRQSRSSKKHLTTRYICIDLM